MPGRLAYREVDRPLVVGGGDDDVGIGDDTFVIGIVVMDKGAAWRLDDADPLSGDLTQRAAGIVAGDLRILTKFGIRSAQCSNSMALAQW
jgi:hypothetical protein